VQVFDRIRKLEEDKMPVALYRNFQEEYKEDLYKNAEILDTYSNEFMRM